MHDVFPKGENTIFDGYFLKFGEGKFYKSVLVQMMYCHVSIIGRCHKMLVIDHVFGTFPNTLLLNQTCFLKQVDSDLCAFANWHSSIYECFGFVALDKFHNRCQIAGNCFFGECKFSEQADTNERSCRNGRNLIDTMYQFKCKKREATFFNQRVAILFGDKSDGLIGYLHGVAKAEGDFAKFITHFFDIINEPSEAFGFLFFASSFFGHFVYIGNKIINNRNRNVFDFLFRVLFGIHNVFENTHFRPNEFSSTRARPFNCPHKMRLLID